MKLTPILAAGLLAVGFASTGAVAQGHHGNGMSAMHGDHDGRWDGDRDRDRDHRWGDRDRRDHRWDGRNRWNGHDNGHHYGWRNNHRRCWTEWRHHRAVRICR